MPTPEDRARACLQPMIPYVAMRPYMLGVIADVQDLVLKAIREAVAEERERLADVCRNAEPWVGKEWAATLANECLHSHEVKS